MGVRITIPHSDFSANGIAVVTNSSITARVVSIQVSGSSNASNGSAYTATATFDDGSTQNVTSQATWSISDNSCSIANGIVTVPDIINKSGVVITASYGGKSATKTVTVTGSVTVGTYLKTTADGQYIPLNSYMEENGTKFGNIKIKAVFKINSGLGGMQLIWVFSTRNATQGAYFSASESDPEAPANVYVRSSSGMQQSGSSNLNTDITVIVDNTGENYKTSFNGTESVYEGTSLPNSSVQAFFVFASANLDNTPDTSKSKAGCVSIKSLQIWSTMSGSETLIFDGIPAVVELRPCLYDNVKKTAHYANTGELVIAQ